MITSDLRRLLRSGKVRHKGADMSTFLPLGTSLEAFLYEPTAPVITEAFLVLLLVIFVFALLCSGLIEQRASYVMHRPYLPRSVS